VLMHQVNKVVHNLLHAPRGQVRESGVLGTDGLPMWRAAAICFERT
jgi:hypothetical protein